MKKAQKLFIIALIAFLAIILIFTLAKIDIGIYWYLPLAIFALIFLLLAGLPDTKNIFFLILTILPAIFTLNNLKINLIQFINLNLEFSLLVNPASLLYTIIVLFFLYTLVFNLKKIKTAPLFYIMLFFVVYAGLSIFWSPDKSLGVLEIIYLLTPLSAYFISYVHFKSPKDILKICWLIIISSFLPLILGLSQYLNHDFFYEPDSFLGRLTGSFAHPNSFGLFLVLIIAVAITTYLSAKEKITGEKKIILFAVASLSLLELILTYSRVSWLSLVIMLAGFALWRRKIIKTAVFALPIAMIIIFLFEIIRDRIWELFSFSLFDSWLARKNIWKIAWEQVLKKPLTGYGLGTAEKVITAGKTWLGGSVLPHNDFLLNLLELGAVGAIFFLALIIAPFYYLVKFLFSPKVIPGAKPFAVSLLIILISFLPAYVFESFSQKIVTQIFLWSLIGAILGQKPIHKSLTKIELGK